MLLLEEGIIAGARGTNVMVVVGGTIEHNGHMNDHTWGAREGHAAKWMKE
jgi:hypothetical protein